MVTMSQYSYLILLNGIHDDTPIAPRVPRAPSYSGACLVEYHRILTTMIPAGFGSATSWDLGGWAMDLL